MSEGDTKILLANVFSPYYQWMSYYMQKLFRHPYAETYSELVNDNPLLLLVSSDKPSLFEVANALEQIDTNAQARLSRSQENASSIGAIIKKYGENSSELKDYVSSNLTDYAAIENVSFMTKAMLIKEGWNESEIVAGYEANLERFQNRQMIRAGAQVGELVGAAIFCAWAPGRLIGVAMSAFAKVGCFAGLGLAVNGYAIYSSLVEYHQNLQDYFSTTDPVRTLKTLEDTRDSFQAVVIAGAFAPAVGAFPKEVVTLAEQALALMK
jgi:hypothetical protein